MAYKLPLQLTSKIPDFYLLQKKRKPMNVSKISVITRSFSFLITIFFIQGAFSQQILITELYRDPIGSESSLCGGASQEFIEILNIGIDTFRIENLFLTDGMEADSVIPLKKVLNDHRNCIYNQSFICPGQFALILDPDYCDAVEKFDCAFTIKDSTVLLLCGDNDIGNGLSSDDGIVLYKGSKKEIDTVIAEAVDSSDKIQSPVAERLLLSSIPNKEGFSIEMQGIVPHTRFGTTSSGITPGWSEYFRSGYMVEEKLGSSLDNGKTVPCTLYCLTTLQGNGGIQHEWELKAGQNQIGKGTTKQLQSRWTLIFDIPLIDADYVFILDGTCWPIDISSVWVAGSPVKINEVFPKNITDVEPEWIELVNTSNMTLNLRNWNFGNSEDQCVFCTENCLLGPGRFIVFTKDRTLFLKKYPGLGPLVFQPSVWHILNNYADTICIWDSHGTLQDRICYNNSWYDNWTDKSLERLLLDNDGIDSSNWALSIESTPGFPNGSSFWRTGNSANIEIGPVPFSPDGDGHDDLLSIKVNLPGAQTVRLSIIGFDGRLLYQFNDVKSQYLWDGKKQNGQYVHNGPFFVVALFNAGQGSSCIRKKGVLWR